MSKNSTFVDMAIHGGTPFGSAGGAAPELRGECSGGIFWRDGGRAKRAAGRFGRLLAAVFSAFQGARQGFGGDFQSIFGLFTHGNVVLPCLIMRQIAIAIITQRVAGF
jgi:hypothetical protein